MNSPTTIQEDNTALIFPAHTQPRFKVDARAIKWKGVGGFREKMGINDNSPKEKVKEALAAHKQAKKEAFRQAKQLTSMLVGDDRFKQVSLTCYTDKKGHQVFSARGTTKVLKDPKGLDDKSKSVEEMTIDELKAVIAEREAGNVVVVNG